jgi:hypothetical protein
MNPKTVCFAMLLCLALGDAGTHGYSADKPMNVLFTGIDDLLHDGRHSYAQYRSSGSLLHCRAT